MPAMLPRPAVMVLIGAAEGVDGGASDDSCGASLTGFSAAVVEIHSGTLGWERNGMFVFLPIM